MFGGIIKTLGTVVHARDGTPVRRMEVAFEKGEWKGKIPIGQSVSINGVCLTVVQKKQRILTFDIVSETLRRTNLGWLQEGDRVNVEFPLTFHDFLGGHVLQGHVDTVGKLVQVEKIKNRAREAPAETFSSVWTIQIPKLFKKFLLYKASVGVDGVSLTIADVRDSRFWVALIPHTLRWTNLGNKKKGDLLNVEFDILGKWVGHYLNLL